MLAMGEGSTGSSAGGQSFHGSRRMLLLLLACAQEVQTTRNATPLDGVGVSIGNALRLLGLGKVAYRLPTTPQKKKGLLLFS